MNFRTKLIRKLRNRSLVAFALFAVGILLVQGVSAFDLTSTGDIHLDVNTDLPFTKMFYSEETINMYLENVIDKSIIVVTFTGVDTSKGSHFGDYGAIDDSNTIFVFTISDITAIQFLVNPNMIMTVERIYIGDDFDSLHDCTIKGYIYEEEFRDYSAAITLPDPAIYDYTVTIPGGFKFLAVTEGKVSIYEDVIAETLFELPHLTDLVLLRSETEKEIDIKIASSLYVPHIDNLPPEADAGYDRMVYQGQEVTFNASFSKDWDGFLDQYYWEFGDDTSGSGPDQIHTYTVPGVYTVVLTVIDNHGANDYDAANVTVLNRVPLVDAEASVSGTSVSFTSSAEDYEEVTYLWEFGDGESSTDQNPTHTYPHTGIYPVKLAGTDEYGAIGYDWLYVEITNTPPVVDAGGPYSGVEGTPISFIGYAYDPDSSQLLYEWDFNGDGIVDSTDENPEWTWHDDYSGEVSLTVTDEGGASVTDTATVSVANQNPIVENNEIYTMIDVSMRITGEKWHNLELFICEGDSVIGYAEGMRVPGNPDEQIVSTGKIKSQLTQPTLAKVVFTPEDDTANGNPYGASPVWLEINFDDGTSEQIQYTFNANQKTGLGAQTWEVVLDPYIEGHDSKAHDIIFEATATDPGIFDVLTFRWEFGDGLGDSHTGYVGSGTDTTIHHYADPGTYIVTVWVEDDDGGMTSASSTITLDFDSKGKGGDVFLNNPPTAQAGSDKTSAAEDEIIIFTSDGSSDPDGHALEYFWNFGDGSTSAQPNPSHAFTRSGSYNVKLWVRDPYGSFDVDEITIIIYNVPPTAAAGDDITVYEDELITFDASGSYDTPSDLPMLRYYWDFGDTLTASGMIVTHTYHELGTYTVALTVKDNDGETDVDTMTVVVMNVPPTVNAGSDQEIMGSTVSFYGTAYDTVSDFPLLNYTWSFGDGENGYEPMITHEYPFSGTYTALLRVIDDDNVVASDSAIIIVHMDTDGDGMLDEWELQYGLDPLSSAGDDGASGDPDGDGLTNSEEHGYGTNPSAYDTDGDGLSDGDEINLYYLSPFDTDNDDDGLSDYSETWGWYYFTEVRANKTFYDTDVVYTLDTSSWPGGFYRATIYGEFLKGFLNDSINLSIDEILISYTNIADGSKITFIAEFEIGDIFEIESAIADFGSVELYIDNIIFEKLGTNPVNTDTDQEGLDDLYESDNGLAPCSKDTDFDAIWDSTEIELWESMGYSETEAVEMAKTHDIDGDELSDGLEIVFNIAPLDPDPDGDGLSDSDEVFQYIPMLHFELGVNLTYDSYTQMFEIKYKDSYMMKFTFYEEYSYVILTLNGENKSYEAGEGYYMFTEDLFPGTYNLTLTIQGFISLEEMIVARQGLNPFNNDWDGDGLEDEWEVKLGANPYEPDTDGDGLLDGNEYYDYNTDPTKADTDGDGLSDYEEMTPGLDTLLTHPLYEDTDEDGLWDGYTVDVNPGELSYSANATNKDSDFDTMPDGWEVDNGLDPANGADAFDDPDFDGLDNAQEYSVGSKAHFPDTDSDGLRDGEEVMGVYFRTNVENGAVNINSYGSQEGPKWIYHDTSGYDFVETLDSNLSQAETIVLSGSGNQFSPKIYGDYIVYLDDSDGDNEIYLYNREDKSTKRITDDDYEQTDLVMYDNYVAWIEWRVGNSGIYLYNIEKENTILITSASGDKKNLGLSENMLVWEDYRNTQADIYFYDMFGKFIKRITDDPSDQLEPSVYKDTIVWVDNSGYRVRRFV
jgi:beta propeller repeat protein